MNTKTDSETGCAGCAQPQAPSSIPIETADRDSAVGRNNTPYNPGSEGHTPCGPLAGDPGAE